MFQDNRDIAYFNVLVCTGEGSQYWSYYKFQQHFPRIAAVVYSNFCKGVYGTDFKRMISITLV